MKVIIRSGIALTMILVTALAFDFFGPIKLSHADSVTTLSSQNYAGWAARNGKFTSVSGSWVVPSVNCTKKNQAVGIWVGIGGLTALQDLQQDGVIIICDSSHHARYLAFYEILPTEAQLLSSTIQPGDHFSASVSLVRKGLFNFQLYDSTQGWSYSHQGKKSGAHLASAECIVEAISDINNHIMALVKFNTTTISNCRENGNPIGTGPSLVEIFMLSQSTHAIKAKPSNLYASGTAFSVQWGQS